MIVDNRLKVALKREIRKIGSNKTHILKYLNNLHINPKFKLIIITITEFNNNIRITIKTQITIFLNCK